MWCRPCLASSLAELASPHLFVARLTRASSLSPARCGAAAAAALLLLLLLLLAAPLLLAPLPVWPNCAGLR